ncbi:MAG: SPFH domain-containing protein [Candidatus Caldarchaeum sp.]|nr:SPFH domain-containing protein [Candidatus Caldarchaeum sp.]MDW8063010.1 SPFH domain-containing protein [Candidatus Caldarchaeum sp.]
MPKVIQWVGARDADIVWRYPVDEIEWGSNLIVEETQAAVFFRDGKAYDVFRAGRHVLTTANLPLLTKILSRVAGFDKVPFKATVVFVSLKQFQGKFGAQGQTRELAPLKFFGSFWFRVSDPNLFVQEVVGSQSAYGTDQLQEFLRAYFNESLIDELSQHGIVDVYGKLDETSYLARNAVGQAFGRIGLELIDVKFEGLDTTPEWRDRIFYLRQGVSAAEVLRMQTITKTAEALSQSQGAAVGAGIAIIPPLFQQPPQQQPTVLVVCPHCGGQNQQGAKFCSSCGKPMTSPQAKCPNGHDVPQGSKFCPECGAKLS